MNNLDEKELEEIKLSIEQYVDEMLSSMSTEEYITLKRQIMESLIICKDDIEELIEDNEFYKEELEFNGKTPEERKILIAFLNILVSTFVGATCANIIAGNEIYPVFLGSVIGSTFGTLTANTAIEIFKDRPIAKYLMKRQIKKNDKLIDSIEQEVWEYEYFLDYVNKCENKKKDDLSMETNNE